MEAYFWYCSFRIQRLLFTIFYVFFYLEICLQISHKVLDFYFSSSPAQLARMKAFYRLSEYSVKFQYVLRVNIHYFFVII